MLYAKSVFKAWVNFWRPPGPSSQISLAREGFGQKIFYFFQLPYYVLMSFLFLLISFLVLTPARKMFKMSLVDYFCISTVLGVSFLQALVELGDNARYGILFHPLIMYVVVTSLWRVFILKED
jgi:hypothetical protein